MSMLLQPGMSVRVRVGFLPSDYALRSSLLLIRNNLTVLEPVVLYGRGARMDMQVEGRGLTHKLFTTLTVKRSFTVVNSGEVAFTVVNMSINNVACENRGFRILNCHPFRLTPNETHILDVAYTPDFLMTWNEAALQFYMHMNGTSWLFPIGASIPRHMLAKCHSALPRPPFESLMYYSCVSALIFCFVCVIACAYLEGDRTVTCALRQQYSQMGQIFDLNVMNRRLLHENDDDGGGDDNDDCATLPIKPTKARQTRTLVKCHGEPAPYAVKTPVTGAKSLSPLASDSCNSTANTVIKRYGYKRYEIVLLAET
ncbi:unnamed protein product [Gongylonema pulchrum]|uniref:TMEM131_like domain-containing protein n=1 Tax=Gongylonema pulchrum TaxID=637853 RepID=A0A3P7PMW5_9BILA|nr:unnamed protein product [Gongylonema pulchrum]